MSNRHRILIIAALALVALAARTLPRPATVHYGAMGRGPVVVLVHGLGSQPSHWLPVARELGAHHRVALVSLPGHDDTPMAEPLSLEGAALALDAALAREVGDQPVVLVGHSVGGLVATTLALLHPERVRGLVLVETLLRPVITGEERAALEAALVRDFDLTLHDVWLGFGRDSLQGESLWRDAHAVDRGVLRTWIRLALDSDLSQSASGLRMPVLAVLAQRSWGESEPWSSAAEALGFTHVPNVDAVRIGGVGHFVMLDEPKRLARAIDRFAAAPGATPVVAGAVPAGATPRW